MSKSSIKSIIWGVAAMTIAVLTLHAAEEASLAGRRVKMELAEADGATANRALPFHGKLASKTDSTITVGSRTFEITSETKLEKDGKAATLADAVVGEPVGGSYLKQDDKLVARTVRFGPKPDADKKSKKEAVAE